VGQEKTKVAILFGGQSTEHQISLLSAQNVFKSLDKALFEPILIGIDKQGQWHYHDQSIKLLYADDPEKILLADIDNPLLLSQNTASKNIYSVKNRDILNTVDVLFPVLHGTYGEDGSVQGLAKLAGLPCVGCGILGSAVGMDKDLMKHVLNSMDIPVANWATLRKGQNMADYTYLSEQLGTTLFIKPANLGSSVGVSKVENASQFEQALELAFRYDPKVIVEEQINGREIECAVLGNSDPRASIPGEVVAEGGFYSYENKYLNEKGAELHIPAQLNPDQVAAAQALALETYIGLEGRGMSRVDMFLTPGNELIINEVNTIPGFTNISMYPKLWEISGLSQQDLITELIQLAMQEHYNQDNLQFS